MTDVFEVTVLDEVFELQESPGIEYRVMLSTGDPGGGTGDVVGPSSSTDGRAAEFDGTTGSITGADRATVVLDPPRAGAGGEVIRDLVRLGPTQIVYVACDPVAFARDAGTLAAAGYELEALRAFDLFPHTHHVEAVGQNFFQAGRRDVRRTHKHNTQG